MRVCPLRLRARLDEEEPLPPAPSPKRRGGGVVIRGSGLPNFSVLLEPLEPCQQNGVLDLLRAPQLLETVPPVEPDPAGRRSFRAVDELLELGKRALQRERLLDDHRAPDRKPRQRLQRIGHLAPL